MVHYIKFKINAKKYERLVKRVRKYCNDDPDMILLNYELMNLEEVCYELYNEALFCPFFSKERKRALLEQVKLFTEAMNLYRYKNGFVY